MRNAHYELNKKKISFPKYSFKNINLFSKKMHVKTNIVYDNWKNPYHRVNFALHHAIGFIYPVTVSYITSINYIKLLSNNNLFSRDLWTTVLHSFGKTIKLLCTWQPSARLKRYLEVSVTPFLKQESTPFVNPVSF